MGDKVRPSTYARARGLSYSVVSTQVQSGLIPVDDDGLIDPDEADTRRAALKSNRGGKRTPESAESLQAMIDDKARKLKADADLAEAKAAEAQGKAVDTDTVAEAWFSAGRELRERLSAIPQRIAPQCAHKTAAAIRKLLAAEIRAALSGLPDTAPGLPPPA